MDHNDPVFKKLAAFAIQHRITFEWVDGSIGFGRPCVGFLRGISYLAYNPTNSSTYEFIDPHDPRLDPPPFVPDAYHKGDYLAVLVHDSDYDTALRQLHDWIIHLESQGEIEVYSFPTGAVGMQAILSGVENHGIRIKATVPAAEAQP